MPYGPDFNSDNVPVWNGSAWVSQKVAEAQITAGTITNASINNSAAIAYSKLNLSGSILNADVNASASIAQSKLAFDSYSAHTPTLTGISIGNGTVAGRYAQIGKFVHYWGSFVLGSTSSVSGGIGVSVPVNLNTVSALVGTAEARDSSSGNRAPLTAYGNGGVTSVQFVGLFTHNGGEQGINNTFPWTWATGDLVYWNLLYEAA